ncbi:MAG: Serine protease [Acidimicrobiales bacterium]|nr:Serine protease [Acidimicrobiales bacterium]
MNLLDAILIVLLVLAAVGGYRLGFVTRIASWVGLLVGLFAAARILPWVTERFPDTDEVQLFLIASGILLAGALAGQVIGYLAGLRLRVVIPEGGARTVDRVGGAVAGIVGIAIVIWLLLPTMAYVPSWPAQLARNSAVARFVDSVFPEPPDAFTTLDSVLGGDNFPKVFEALTPTPAVGEPPAGMPVDQETLASVQTRAVRVEGVACQQVQLGSGFVVSAEVVATNAHVVAGVTEPYVIRDDDVELPATTIHFDPDRDLALLSVPGMDRQPLPLGDAEIGEQGVVMGFPGGGSLRLEPYEIGRDVTANGTDIYDTGSTSREVFVIASGIGPGDSGAALVDTGGEVVAVAFAIAPDRENVAYALQTEELQAVLSAFDPAPDPTGPCLG